MEFYRIMICLAVFLGCVLAISADTPEKQSKLQPPQKQPPQKQPLQKQPSQNLNDEMKNHTQDALNREKKAILISRPTFYSSYRHGYYPGYAYSAALPHYYRTAYSALPHYYRTAYSAFPHYRYAPYYRTGFPLYGYIY